MCPSAPYGVGVICIGNVLIEAPRKNGCGGWSGFIIFITGRGVNGSWYGLVIESDGCCYHTCLGPHQCIVGLIVRGTWIVL